MALDYSGKHCAVAAEMLGTEPGLLDYRLINLLDEIATMVEIANGTLISRQAIAVAIALWRQDQADDFTNISPSEQTEQDA